MRRGLLISVIFLFAGAFVNVAVAWGLALWRPWPHTLPYGDYREGLTLEGENFYLWQDSISKAAGVVTIHSQWFSPGPALYDGIAEERAEDVLPSWASFAHPSGQHPPSTPVDRIIDARGWPLVSLWPGLEYSGFPAGTAPNVGAAISVTHGYLSPSQRSLPFSYVANLRIIPLKPIWFPSFLNTLFYPARDGVSGIDE